ncbi:MAG TPA: PIN domain-containing protein [Methylomirabilota bacterium]
MVLVDTSVWSLALRRRPADLDAAERAVVGAWTALVRRGRASMIGPIRQEILSGIRQAEVFRALQAALADVPCLPINLGDYDRAAEFFSRCRSNGITGGHIDMLICAAAHRHRVPLLTTDPDFSRYARHVPLKLHQTPR